MKKLKFPALILAMYATGSMAASVTLYGTADLGMNYTNQKASLTESGIFMDAIYGGPISASASNDRVNMVSGMYAPSRWGICGSEKLAPGYSVSFKLESGFNADTGTQGDSSRFFNRESQLTLSTPYGDLSLGRMGSMTSSAGTYDIFMGRADIYDGGWGTNGAALGASNFFYEHTRFDNMMTYASPEAAGFRGYLQYSSQTDSVNDLGVEGKPSSRRYYGVGVTYDKGPLSLALVVDSIHYGHGELPDNRHTTDVSFGGNYDFGKAKLYAAIQWGKNELDMGGANQWWDTQGLTADNPYLKGYTMHLGIEVPVAGGRFKSGLYYSYAKNDYLIDSVGSDSVTGSGRVKVLNIAASYEYPLSRKTTLYAGVGFAQAKTNGSIDVSDETESVTILGSKQKERNFDVAFGICHTF